ncbi:MAG TPA: DUF2225 domain-containing protein [Clostridiales bacterium]|nr:DUF2225 domain-containing protein [Clostridiales bacterium]
MTNLFKGLEEFGLGNLSKKIEIYEEKNETDTKQSLLKKPVPITEEEVLFEKTFNCPVCGNDFKSKMVKSGKVKLLTQDTDLRPVFQHVDPLKYDAVVCPRCGYAALNRFFKYLTDTQISLIKSTISASFKGLSGSGDTLSYDEAITRHKLALVNSIVKKSKTSERAYICLKTAWVIRGKIENLSTEEETSENQMAIKNLQKEEEEFIQKAYEGFNEAILKEAFPMCRMDESTVSLLIADLARRTHKYEEASRWLSKILVSRNSNERIKEKAREIKDLMRESLSKNE